MSALTKRCAAVSRPSCRSLSSFNRSMSVSSASFCWIWISLLFLVSTSAGVKEINAKSGDSVTLQCNSSRNALFKLLEWIKIQQPENLNVYVWRDEKSSPDDQNDDFKNRVELKDPEMKDGDVSVILKNVNINDTGTYECYVGNGGKPELINTINLTVEPGPSREHTGLIVGVSLTVVALVVSGIVGFVLYRKGHRGQDSY
ncbi:T-cell surface glycoprotein CD4-like isoform X1 [Anabas testudineus]|uniref:T-cell surface glycoprotein CD4-like isoform X1 n=1 Tax=Anabas testudineus TaxID=64144 RepID=UPI000E463AB0|nr:T-cell surface glycoprotein CD4-like isoform X1 [Anabas testudineus]